MSEAKAFGYTVGLPKSHWSKPAPTHTVTALDPETAQWLFKQGLCRDLSERSMSAHP